jgi:hypothetical protein
MVAVEARVLRRIIFNRHHRDLSAGGLIPAILLVVYVIIRLISS